MTLDAASAQDGGSNFDNSWHSAEGHHFWILAQQQVYEGNYEGAMRTGLHLRNYESIISPEQISSLLAVASFHCNFFGQCSKVGFSHLNSMNPIGAEK